MFEEHAHDVQGENTQGNLIKSLVRASLDEKLMTQEEVIGNIFVFNFAGHDTTAHSLAFTFMLMAANPEVQEWMGREIQHVMGDKDLSKAGYSLMPRLVRTLAVLVSWYFV
jgi:cytochrome P450